MARAAVLPVWNAVFWASWWPIYHATRLALNPANHLLAWLHRRRFVPDSVLHLSFAVHTAHATVRILRQSGWNAAYMAIGVNPHWQDSDFVAPRTDWPHLQAWREFRTLWAVMAKYATVHCHFMLTMSRTGWELGFLRRMGRGIVVHYRGCEIRDRERNMALHPAGNICEDCDYKGAACTGPDVMRRRVLAKRYGNAVLVTTPDMLDFAPDATHLPFFIPDVVEFPAPSGWQSAGLGGRPFRIVHATNHPGLEGTGKIEAAVEELRRRGLDVEFRWFRDTSHDAVVAGLREADLAIGKMKMGYYANFQVEAMASGVPTVTWIRPELRPPGIESSGFIICRLRDLPDTLEEYIRNPALLAEKRRTARTSILALHNNARTAGNLISLYRRVSPSL